MGRFLRNFLVLLLLPTLVLLVLSTWVILSQPKGHGSNFYVTVRQPVIWPWQQALTDIHFRPLDERSAPKPIARPVLFLVDSSGSMSGKMEEVKIAIVRFVKNISGSADSSFAVVFFAGTAKTIMPFTNEYSQVAPAIDAAAGAVGGGTNFLPALEHVQNYLLGTNNALVIMLTDGGASESVTALSDFFQNRWMDSGHELYLVGVGSAVSVASFYALTNDPQHYIVTRYDGNAVSDVLFDTATRIGNLLGTNVKFTLDFTEPLLMAAVDSAEAQRYRSPGVYDESLDRFDLSVLFNSEQTWTIPLESSVAGVYPVLSDNAQLGFEDTSNSTQTFESEKIPLLLVITWWFLFFLYLPAILYLLLWVWRYVNLKRQPPIEPIAEISRSKLLFPEALRLPRMPENHPVSWSPALIVGLGATGREILSELQQELADSYDIPETRPVLLALDIGSRDNQSYHDSDGGSYLNKLPQSKTFLLPRASTRVKDFLPESGELFGLNLKCYQHLSTDLLNMENGSGNRPSLARVGLLKELQKGQQSELYIRLQQAANELRALIKAQHAQVILVGNVNGGVGQSWIVPITLVLQSLLQEDKKNGVAIDFSLLLTGKRVNKRGSELSIEAPELIAELDVVANAGKVAVPYQIGSDTAPLVQTIVSRPYDNAYVLPYDDWRHGAVEAAQALCFQVDDKQRSGLVHTLQSIKGTEAKLRAQQTKEKFTQVRISGVSFPGSYFNYLVLDKLLLGLMQQEIVFPGISDGGISEFSDASLDEFLKGMQNTDATKFWNIRDSLLSDFVNPASRPDKAELVNQLQSFRICFLNALNSELQSKQLSLHQVPRLCTLLERRLGNAMLGDEAFIFDPMQLSLQSLRRQSLIWLEVFCGSDFMQEQNWPTAFKKGTDSLAGLVADVQSRRNYLAQKLNKWQSAKSRNISLWEQTAEPINALESFADENYEEILSRWLGVKENFNQSLNERITWQVNSPGSGGEPVAIEFVINSTSMLHFVLSKDVMSEVVSALLAEISLFTRSGNFYQILQHLQNREMQDAELQIFAATLKNDMEAVKQQVLVSLPKSAPDNLGQKQLWEKLQQVFQNDLAGAAEKIRVCQGSSMNHLYVLRVEPLLTGQTQLGANHEFFSAQQKLLDHYGKLYCDAHDLEVVKLPISLSLVLADIEALKQFYQHVKNGAVYKSIESGLWCMYSTDEEIALTLYPEESLADATACFIESYAIHPVTQTNNKLELVTEEDELVWDFISWLSKGGE